jgi:hypothetical protein
LEARRDRSGAKEGRAREGCGDLGRRRSARSRCDRVRRRSAGPAATVSGRHSSRARGLAGDRDEQRVVLRGRDPADQGRVRAFLCRRPRAGAEVRRASGARDPDGRARESRAAGQGEARRIHAVLGVHARRPDRRRQPNIRHRRHVGAVHAQRDPPRDRALFEIVFPGHDSCEDDPAQWVFW